MGVDPRAAAAAITLVMLVNDVTLRGLIPANSPKGFGFFQSKPSSAFSPVAVTPDELGAAWDGGELHLPLLVMPQRRAVRTPERRRRYDFRFPAADRPCGAHAAAGGRNDHRLRHGLEPRGRRRSRQADRRRAGVGYSCLAEMRMVETILEGAPKTPFLRFGDRCESR